MRFPPLEQAQSPDYHHHPSINKPPTNPQRAPADVEHVAKRPSFPASSIKHIPVRTTAAERKASRAEPNTDAGVPPSQKLPPSRLHRRSKSQLAINDRREYSLHEQRRDVGVARQRHKPAKSASWNGNTWVTVSNMFYKQPRIGKSMGGDSGQPSIGSGGQRGGVMRNGGLGVNPNGTSSSSTTSTESALADTVADEFQPWVPECPKDVMVKFGLNVGEKPAFFDRDAKHEGIGGFVESAAVSCGGRTNFEWKKENQDTFMMESSDKDDMVLLGVFDGHGVHGGIASACVRDQLVGRLRTSNGSLWNRIRQDPEQTLKDIFADIDNNLCKRKVDWSRSGTTAVVVIIDSSWTMAAWVGDSRAVRGERIIKCNSSHIQIKGVDMSKDHKPENPKERKRILACNGRIDQMIVDAKGTRAGPSRVYLKYVWQPGLATSRAFGDTMAKMVGVIAEPEFEKHSFQFHDEMIILASDGVWEVVSSQEAVEIAKAHNSPSAAANALVAISLQRWLRGNRGKLCDDVTAIVCFLNHKKGTRHFNRSFKNRKSMLPCLAPKDALFPCMN